MTDHWVVVGAGSAGCVVANRMSADGSRRVTLLEAGPALDADNVPAAIEGPNFLDAVGVSGRTYPDLVATHTPGATERTYLRGRGIGGSSAVNAMVVLPGSAELYDRFGWEDASLAFDRAIVPAEPANDRELGVIDRALLAADGRTERARLMRSGGRRVTAAESYLWPVAERSNLTVRADSGVAAVLFDDNWAVGVELESGEQISADRVVVAGGAIHSPALLLRSGVVVNGLGNGLQDHPSAPLTLQLRAGVEQDTSGLALATLLEETTAEHGTVQLLPMNHLGTEATGLALLMVALMTPHSHAGMIRLDDNNEPVVDFNLLDDERDVAAMVHGVRLAVDVLSRPAFTDIVETVFIDDVGTTLDALTDDTAIVDWLRSHCGDYVHATGTCAMGTVVDSDGRVKGYEQLFVCDASVFPSIPDVNTHLPTTMLAERLCTRWA